MRIVGGAFRGHALSAPAGLTTRPTSDRLRETLFNILMHSFADFRFDGAVVLDLFAGTGALGLEALSRGAKFSLFVEDAPTPRAAIRGNIESLGLTGRSKIFRRDATQLGPRPPSAGGPFNLVFCDPPYEKGLVRPALISAKLGDWLSADALCVVECAKTDPTDFEPNFMLLDRREYGGTALLFLRPR